MARERLLVRKTRHADYDWDLTPLTARVLASLTAQVGVGALVLSFDRRWSSWRLIVETFFVATAFLLVGAVRAWDDFDADNDMTYLYVGGLGRNDLARLLLYVREEGRAKDVATPPGMQRCGGTLRG